MNKLKRTYINIKQWFLYIVSGSAFENCKHLKKKEVHRDYPDAYIEFECLECGEMIYEDMYND
jgi:hypothetical protein